jgi:hypothetical protein
MVARFRASALERTLIPWSKNAYGAESNHPWAPPQISPGSGPLLQGECRFGPCFRGGDWPTTDSMAVSGAARKKGLSGGSKTAWVATVQPVSRTFLRRLASETDKAARNTGAAAAIGVLAQLPESPADFAEALKATLSIC